MNIFLPIANELGRAVLHSVWEDAALALVFALTMSLLRSGSAAVRYAIGCATLALMVVAPIATIALTQRPRPASTQTPIVNFVPLPAMTITNHAAAPATFVEKPANLSLLQIVAIVWALGFGVVSFWQVNGWFAVRRLVRFATPADDDLGSRLRSLSQRVGVRIQAALKLSDHITTPVLIGWLRPVILIPPSALCELPADYLESLLLHELAHVRRHDYLVNLLQTIAETLLFYHPAAWWVGSAIRIEREHCCDDQTVRYADRKVYVKALALVESFRSDNVAQLALTATGGHLLRRIQRLTGTPATHGRSSAGFLAILALLIAIAVLSATHAADTTSKSKEGPTTQPASLLSGLARGILPADLIEPQYTTYRIQPGDRLSISVSDLLGPNTTSNRTTTVTDKGLVSLLVVTQPISISGLTEMEAEKAVAKAYHDEGLIERAMVTVNVSEARAQSFSIVGAVSHAGQFAITDPRFHVLDAIALAGGTVGDIHRIVVLRATSQGGIATAIDIPADRVLNGDPSCNIIVRPRDTVVVSTSTAVLPAQPSTATTTSVIRDQPAAIAGLTDEDLRPTPNFTLGPNDLVQVQIFTADGKESIKQARATSTGAVNLPRLSHAVKIAEMTDEKARSAVLKAYRDAGIDDVKALNLTVIERRTAGASVIGYVHRPGMYPLTLTTRLLDCVKLAQGFNDPRPLHIRIEREYPKGSGHRTLELNAADIVEDDLHSNIYMRPGDTILVTLNQ